MKQVPNPYDDIPIPEELSHVVDQALRRGIRRRRCRRLVSGMAAMLAAVLLTANIPALYTGAAELPLVGRLVRIMRVGSGGQQSSGVCAAVCPGEDAVALHFSHRDGSPSGVPVFSAIRRTAPDRLVLRLHGMEELDMERLTDALRQQPSVADAYPMACSSAADRGLSILLEPGRACTVSQHSGPDSLMLTFRADDTPPSEGPVFYLQSRPMAFGEALAALSEALTWEGATQVRTADGRFLVVLGSYADRDQARKARQGILEKAGIAMEIGTGSPHSLPSDQSTSTEKGTTP